MTVAPRSYPWVAMADLPLRHELVPRPLWGLSVHRKLKGGRWDRLRRAVLDEAGGRCQSCGDVRERSMVCHEVWDYDDDAGMATLRWLRILCPPCNFATHRGRTSKIATSDLAEQADAHMARVNDLRVEEVRELYREALLVWGKRSEREWKVAIDPLLVERYPVLHDIELAPRAAPP